MNYNKTFFALILSLFLSGCKTDWEKQQAFLLPTENKLILTSNEDGVMTTINVFSVSGVLNQKSLINYPIQKIQGKAIKKWHKISMKEIEDLEEFFQSEPIKEKIKKKVLNSIRQGNCYVAYMFSFNDKAPPLEKGYAHRDHNPIPGEKGYNTMNWVDMYYLDLKSKELVHISYGKF